MDFTVNREALISELKVLRGVVRKSAMIPILSTVLIEADGNRLSLTGTDLDTVIKTDCEADISEAGSVALPLGKLKKVLRACPSQAVRINRPGDKTVCVTSGDVKFQMWGQDAENFPKSPPLGELTMLVSAKVLAKLITRTVYAITREESRYALNCALIELHAESIKMVTTDGHRMAIASAPFSSPLPALKLLVSKTALVKVAELAAEQEGGIWFGADNESVEHERAYFKIGRRVLISRLPSGKFPDYTKVIPANTSTLATLNARSLTRALTTAAVMMNERHQAITLNFNRGSLAVSCEDVGFGSAEASLPIESDASQTKKTAFNHQYLGDFLETIDEGGDINFAMNPDEEHPPAVLTPVGADDYTYIVMQMRLG